MRVAVVLHDFALGGTERIAVRLADAWAKAGAEASIFCGSADGPMRSLLPPTVQLFEARHPIARGPFSMKRLARAAARHFRQRPVDGIFIPGNFHWPLIATLATLDPRPRIVAQISSALVKDGRAGLRQRYFEARSRRRLADADSIVALAERAAEEARAILRRPVEVIRLPVLGDDPVPPLPFPDGEPLIVGAGRFVGQKDFITLVEAFARLRHPSARLTIVGDGPERRRVAKRVRRLGLQGRVCLPGYQPDIRPWLDRSRLFALSSRHEGYGAVVVEALAAGRPVVATDCTPATSELLGDRDAGMTVPVADPIALARALDDMLDRAAPDPGAVADRVAPWKIGPIAGDYLKLFADIGNP